MFSLGKNELYEEEAELVKVMVGDVEVQPDENGMYVARDLDIDTTYPVTIYTVKDGEESTVRIDVPTKALTFKKVNIYQTKMECIIPSADDRPEWIGNVGILCSNGKYYVQKQDTVVVDGLEMGTSYRLTPYITYNGQIVEGTADTGITRLCELSMNVGKTQTSLTMKDVSGNFDSSVDVEELGVTIDGNKYVFDGSPIVLSDLMPNSRHPAVPYVKYNDGLVYTSSQVVYVTIGLEPELTVVSSSPTTLRLRGSYIEGDALVTTGFTDYCTGNDLVLYGLDPSTEYTVEYYAETDKGYRETATYTFTTPALTFNTLPAKATSNTCAVICAETNLSDEEAGTGFEWRRTDAPDIVPSTDAPCAVNGGVMEGMLRNLSANTYYQYRPYYESESGKRYYGEWIGVGTADAYVYFTPTVHTYATASVESNSAVLSGYALAGSDDIQEQGFEYWIESVGTRAAQEVHTVKAGGQRMKVSIDGLEYNSTYTYRAYVRTEKETFYGEELSFTTPYPTGIEDAAAPAVGGLDVQVSCVPGRGWLDVRVTGAADVCRYRLVSVGGGTLASGELAADGTWQRIEAVRQSKGICLLQVAGGGQSKTVKLLMR